MENTLPINLRRVKKTNLIINRLHIFTQGFALLALIYYRTNFLFQIIKIRDKNTPFLPHALVFLSELILSFLWVLSQAFQWNPISRKVFPERLPGNDKLPSIDVFICTTNPIKEPSVDVMNTLISAMALDYPADKLHVYLSDDGGSSVTFQAVKEAWKFLKWWIPFCRKYEVKTRCPVAYFSADESKDENEKFSSTEFIAEKKKIEKKYEEFKRRILKIIENTSSFTSRDHDPLIQVINDENCGVDSDKTEMPLLVYVSREKRPFHSHHFKAGALNVLLRVSGLISNSPYILVLDCDMYCNDPTSGRQAMCFFLDPKISPKLGFVQFPQKFHNIRENDIYDSQLRFFWPKLEGVDGLRGSMLVGTGFYIKREALYRTSNVQEDNDLVQLQKAFGPSYEFIKSLQQNYKLNASRDEEFSGVSLKEIRFLASCGYDNNTKWGKEVGFRYFSVLEDYFTSFNLHCNGWISVYLDPAKPCFLGSATTNLNEIIVQYTRWVAGLVEVAVSRFSPLIYGPLRMSTLQSMCYANSAYDFLIFLPVYCLAIVPQLCLLHGIHLYPKVTNPFFIVFSFLFLSSQLKHIQEVFSSGHSIRTWAIEQRIWMLRSLTCYMYGTLNGISEMIGLRAASFLPTDKAENDEQSKLYQMGIYDFQASGLLLAPLCTLYILNVVVFIIGVPKIFHIRQASKMFIQLFIPLFGILINYPLFEGMFLRKDDGRVAPSITILSAALCIIILSFGSLALIY
ncbi:cellulose synthase G2 [Olea europaea subsp. europaea]|uniref:Cellulose synthase G2 n=1 Tax=Olea europaea subsp. europaea TaxID=158383 RepID=A0A8S0QAR9_OLEEU|nr:cellulose synthase G2 [Olea europaea subsp. europaea]